MSEEILKEIIDKRGYVIFKKGIQKDIWDQQPAVVGLFRWAWILTWMLILYEIFDNNQETMVYWNIFSYIFILIAILLSAFRKKNRKWFRMYYNSKVKI